MDSSPPPVQSSLDLRDLYRYMASREFVAGRAELLEQGFGPHRLRSWRRSGRLVNPFRGVYSYGRDVQTRNAALRGALIVAGDGAALTGRTALESWGAIKVQREIPHEIEVATPVDRDGLEILRAALALIDFALASPETEVRFAFLELCRLKLFGKKDLEFCVRRAAGRRGISKLKPLLGLWVPELERIRSVLEGLFLLAWMERRLKMPEVNVKVYGREVDFFWREERLALELDGAAYHSDPIARKRDLEKQQFLESKGLRVLRGTWKEFTASPDDVIGLVLAELDLRRLTLAGEGSLRR